MLKKDRENEECNEKKDLINKNKCFKNNKEVLNKNILYNSNKNFFDNFSIDSLDYSNINIRRSEEHKSSKLSTISLVYVYSRKGSRKNKHTHALKALFDTGCGATLINKKFVKDLPKKRKSQQSWKTKTGSFNTKETCKVTFALPQFHKHREISWNMHVDESNSEMSDYDIIIGRDLMHEIGLEMNFQTGRMTWDNAWINMQDPDLFKEGSVEEFEKELFMMHDPDTTEAERIQRIVDVKYAPADLQAEVNSLTKINGEQKKQLLTLLSKFKTLFDGTLGDWKTEPVDLILKDPKTVPVYQKPYPVPKSKEKKLKEECQRLVDMKILRKINKSEWGNASIHHQ